MPRLFTGLEIPVDTGMRLAFLRGGLHRAVWIDQESYHITLRFIGDIDDRSADEVADALARIRRKSFDVTISGIDSFGGPRPHSVFARVEPCAALMDLQAEQERILQRLGFPPEGRRYTPHVTIARTKGASQRDVAEWLTIRGGFTAGTFKAERFVLFSSKASRGGGPYIVEEGLSADGTRAEADAGETYDKRVAAALKAGRKRGGQAVTSRLPPTPAASAPSALAPLLDGVRSWRMSFWLLKSFFSKVVATDEDSDWACADTRVAAIDVRSILDDPASRHKLKRAVFAQPKNVKQPIIVFK